MPVVTCPNPDCSKSYQVPADLVRREVQCRKCGRKFVAGESQRDSIVLQSVETSITAAEPAGHAEAGTPPVSRAGSKAPSWIGRFHIREKLGQGAFGTVYLAFDPQLDREVAIKVPLAGLSAKPSFVARFLREARAAARLNHPYIVPVYDAGQDGDQPYIASAFIQGKPLSDEIGAFSGDYRRIAQVVRRLADALQYAHSQQIVHRDVKPHNVMLDEDDEPHLMDFGLARVGTEAGKLTHDGALMGTPAYMSPEQAAAKTSEITAASDQYSLGVILYELLTGITPFAGSPSVIIYNILNRPLPRPRGINSGIPRDLETICLKALAAEPDRRYETCEKFADDLNRWQEDCPITARRASVTERTVRWCRKNRVVASLAATVFVVAAVGFAATWASLQSERQARDLANEHAEQSRQLAEDAQRAKASADFARKEAEQAKDKAVDAAHLARQREDELAAKNEELEQTLAELTSTKSQLAEVEETRDEKIAAAEGEAAMSKQLAEQAADSAARLKENAPLLSYVQTLEKVSTHLKEGNREEARDVLDTTQKELRGVEWHWLSAIADQTATMTDRQVGAYIYGAFWQNRILQRLSAPESRIATNLWLESAAFCLPGNRVIRWKDGVVAQLLIPDNYSLVGVGRDLQAVALREIRSKRSTLGNRFALATFSQPLFSSPEVAATDIRVVPKKPFDSSTISFANTSAGLCAIDDDGGLYYFDSDLKLIHSSRKGNFREIATWQWLFPELVQRANSTTDGRPTFATPDPISRKLRISLHFGPGQELSCLGLVTGTEDAAKIPHHVQITRLDKEGNRLETKTENLRTLPTSRFNDTVAFDLLRNHLNGLPLDNSWSPSKSSSDCIVDATTQRIYWIDLHSMAMPAPPIKPVQPVRASSVTLHAYSLSSLQSLFACEIPLGRFVDQARSNHVNEPNIDAIDQICVIEDGMIGVLYRKSANGRPASHSRDHFDPGEPSKMYFVMRVLDFSKSIKKP